MRILVVSACAALLWLVSAGMQFTPAWCRNQGRSC